MCEGAGFRYSSDVSFQFSVLYHYDGFKSLHMRCASGRGSIMRKAVIFLRSSSAGSPSLLGCTIDHRHT